MAMRLNVLMADASAADAERVADALRRDGYDVSLERIQRAAEMTAALDRQPWDLVLANDTLPGFDALAALRLLRERAPIPGRSPDLPLIVITDQSSPLSLSPLDLDRVRDAVREGARDF